MSHTVKVQLSLAVLAATTLCPQITANLARAAHGPLRDRLQRLHAAQQHLTKLAQSIAVAEATCQRAVNEEAAAT
jgi:hypothetical protein